MKDKLTLEEYGKRKIIFNLMLLVYNYQCSAVGINQILNSTYMNEDTAGFRSFKELQDLFAKQKIGYFAYENTPDTMADDMTGMFRASNY